MLKRRLVRFVAACVLLGALLPLGLATQVAAASTITVCPSGCDATTIQAALTAATPGDTIDVAAGTFTENGLTIDKSVTIRGVAPSPAVVDPKDLLTPGVLQTIIQTGGPGNGPTFTLMSPGSGTSPQVTFKDLAIVGNDDFDTIRIASNDPVLIQSVEFDGVALTGSRTAVNTTGLRPIHGFRITDSAVTCTGALNPTGGILLGVADGVGDTIAVTDNYMAQCGWPINAGNHAGFGTTDAVAGSVAISGNHMEENRFGCVLIALSYADLTISDNTFVNCDLSPGTFDGAVNLQALTPATVVTVSGNEITRVGASSGGNIGVIIQNIPASAGNLARFVVEDNFIHGLTQSGTSDGIRLGPTAISRAAADIDIDILANTLTGNTRGMSWQTNAGSAIGLNLDVHRNRIAGNTARAISLFGGSRTLNAENNWFGCNDGPRLTTDPSPSGCDRIGVGTPSTSSVDADPWLTLSISALPTAIQPDGDTSAITASLTTNSDAATVANPIPDGTVIAFATDLGLIAPPSTGTSGGVAGAILTSQASTGVANVQATLDNAIITVPVTIADTIPPTIDPHGPITVNAMGVGGALVTYTSPATHDTHDGDGVATCLPASGSLFPIGTTPVLCDAVDAAGNNAIQTSFTITVLSAKQIKQAVLANLQAIAGTGDNDANKHIDKAIEALQKSLDPANWFDANHLISKHGEKVFDEEKKAVKELGDIKNPAVNAAVISSSISSIVDADRLLADVAISEGGGPKDVAKATDELANGDADRTAGKNEQAIDHYKKAWKHLKG